MKIKLSNGKYTLIDKEDYERLNAFKWRESDYGYVLRSKLIMRDGKKVKIRIYIAAEVMGGAKEGYVIDHINKDRSDNRKINLRYCLSSENSKNRKIQKNNKTGYKGVRRNNKDGGTWSAQIAVNGKRIRGKPKNSPKEAAKDYNRLAKKYHGKFASLNDIKD